MYAAEIASVGQPLLAYDHCEMGTSADAGTWAPLPQVALFTFFGGLHALKLQ